MESHPLLINALSEQVMDFAIATLEPSNLNDTISLMYEPDITLPTQLKSMETYIRVTVPSGNYIYIFSETISYYLMIL